MKSVLKVLLPLTLISASAFAQTPKQLALEYIELSKAKEIFDISIKTFVDQAVASNPTVDHKELTDRFNQIMGWNALKDPTIELILQAFSADELKAINKFFKTPAGKTYAEKSPWLSAEVSKLIIANASKVELPTSELDQQLNAIANETNKSLPMNIDEQTRLDSTIGANGQFYYLYTLITYAAEELSAEQVDAALRPNIANTLCTNPAMSFFKDNYVPVTYSYKGKNGKHVVDITVKGSDC